MSHQESLAPFDENVMEEDTPWIEYEQNLTSQDMEYEMETEGEGIPTSLHSDAFEYSFGCAEENMKANFQAPSPDLIERPSHHPELISPGLTSEYHSEGQSLEHEEKPKKYKEEVKSVVPQSVREDEYDAIFSWQEDLESSSDEEDEENWDPRIAIGPAFGEPPKQQDIGYLPAHFPAHVHSEVRKRRAFSPISKYAPSPFLPLSTTVLERLREEGIEVTDVIQSDLEWWMLVHKLGVNFPNIASNLRRSWTYY